MITTFVLSIITASLASPGDTSVIRDAWRPRDHVERLTVEQDPGRRVFPRQHARGHREGVYIGFTNFLEGNNKIYRGALELDWARSFTARFNAMDRVLLASRSRRTLLLGGLGLEYNRLCFDRDVTVRRVDGKLEDVPLSRLGATDARRSVFKALYLAVPLLLDVRYAPRGYISGGVVGAALLHSKTKIVHDRGNNKRKIKQTSSYYMNPLKADLMVSLHFAGISVWASRALTPMFDVDKAPRVYPFTIGIGLLGP
ncbi:MAG: hypothetical protein LBD64_00720 [Odoribacteraceae bacterium]|nr:hypothetical protein [Odoribacteraceae bacterium]